MIKKKFVFTRKDVKYLVRVEATKSQPNRTGKFECMGLSGRRCLACNNGGCYEANKAYCDENNFFQSSCLQHDPNICFIALKSKQL